MLFIKEILMQFNNSLNLLVWGFPMMALMMGTGLYLSAGTGFLQFRRFRHMMKSTIGSAFVKSGSRDKGTVSPFQAVTTALAGTVGTGNIAGVAGAISLGGPGAVFWMCASALLGMVTKYAEVVLAVKFRERNAQGDWVGGPMYYIKNGLGRRFGFLAAAFSLFGMLASFGIGNMAQVNTISGSFAALAAKLLSGGISDKSAYIVKLSIGLIVALAVALVLLGGIRRIGTVSEKLVPLMSLVYVTAALTVIGANFERVVPVLERILVSAFDPGAVLGGAAGIGIVQAIKRGVGRGVFSNEAGLGSAPIAHAATSETDPVKQGLFGIFEVFADTVFMCTLTALAILVSGAEIPYGKDSGVELTIAAFSTAFGGKAAGLVLSVCIVLFALCSMLSWALYGSRCAEYLFGTKVLLPYKAVFVVFIVIGSVIDIGLAWRISDTLNGLMAVPNLIALLALSGVVFEETHRHFGFGFRQKRHK